MEEIITLSNNRLRLDITNYGGRVMKWLVDGVDIVLGFDTIDEYKSAKEPYHSALIGRYANRIANASYEYHGVVNVLNQNHDKHILHGGNTAFHNSRWDIVSKSDNYIELRFVSQDGDQGFPGRLTTTARYELGADSVRLSMTATATKSTPVSVTHHPYFNLSGLNSSTLDQHLFQINSNHILVTDAEGIPSGERMAVGGSGFDFTQWKSLKQGMIESHAQIDQLGGIDHTYINDCQVDDLKLQAEAKAIDSKVHMQIYSNQPGMQFYTANHFDGSDRGKNNRYHLHRGAFCFEPQMWPDSPNQATFPLTILTPNDVFSFSTEYKFPIS